MSAVFMQTFLGQATCKFAATAASMMSQELDAGGLWGCDDTSDPEQETAWTPLASDSWALPAHTLPLEAEFAGVLSALRFVQGSLRQDVCEVEAQMQEEDTICESERRLITCSRALDRSSGLD